MAGLCAVFGLQFAVTSKEFVGLLVVNRKSGFIEPKRVHIKQQIC